MTRNYHHRTWKCTSTGEGVKIQQKISQIIIWKKKKEKIRRIYPPNLYRCSLHPKCPTINGLILPSIQTFKVYAKKKDTRQKEKRDD